MQEHGFSLTRIVLYKDKLFDFALYVRMRVSENLYSRIFYAVFVDRISENIIEIMRGQGQTIRQTKKQNKFFCHLDKISTVWKCSRKMKSSSSLLFPVIAYYNQVSAMVHTKHEHHETSWNYLKQGRSFGTKFGLTYCRRFVYSAPGSIFG